MGAFAVFLARRRAPFVVGGCSVAVELELELAEDGEAEEGLALLVPAAFFFEALILTLDRQALATEVNDEKPHLRP